MMTTIWLYTVLFPTPTPAHFLLPSIPWPTTFCCFRRFLIIHHYTQDEGKHKLLLKSNKLRNNNRTNKYIEWIQKKRESRHPPQSRMVAWAGGGSQKSQRGHTHCFTACNDDDGEKNGWRPTNPSTCILHETRVEQQQHQWQ